MANRGIVRYKVGLSNLLQKNFVDLSTNKKCSKSKITSRLDKISCEICGLRSVAYIPNIKSVIAETT